MDMLLNLFMSLLVLVDIVSSQLPSPCPDKFTYERTKNRQDQDRWYGVISITPEEDFQGILLTIVLDSRVQILGVKFQNWTVRAFSNDNIEFSAANTQESLKAGKTSRIRFFVKYNRGGQIPSLKAIRVNGKTICVEDDPVQYTPIMFPPDRKSVKREEKRLFQSDEDDDSDDEEEDDELILKYQSPKISALDILNMFGGDFRKVPPSNLLVNASHLVYMRNRGATCGSVVNDAIPLIAYGQNTSLGQFPWHVCLYRSSAAQMEQTLTYTCGGTLISEQHILTAAHCVIESKNNKLRLVRRSYMLVYLGKYKLRSFGPEVQLGTVGSIKVHPEYRPDVLFNDIAMLKLNQPVLFSRYVKPACLWDGGHTFDPSVGTVVGWGFDEKKTLTNRLIKTEMPVLSTKECLLLNRDVFSQLLSENNFCAGFSNGTALCCGDSGGGMVFPKSTNRGTVWQLRGIVSVGVALRGVCDTTQPSLFTDVAKYLPWIKEILDKN